MKPCQLQQVNQPMGSRYLNNDKKTCLKSHMFMSLVSGAKPPNSAAIARDGVLAFLQGCWIMLGRAWSCYLLGLFTTSQSAEKVINNEHVWSFSTFEVYTLIKASGMHGREKKRANFSELCHCFQKTEACHPSSGKGVRKCLPCITKEKLSRQEEAFSREKATQSGFPCILVVCVQPASSRYAIQVLHSWKVRLRAGSKISNVEHDDL